MNINKSVFGVLSILVAVIVVATVAIPVIEDSSKEIRTSQNNVAEKYMMTESTTGEFTIEATETTGTYIINGESKTFNTDDYSNFYCVLTNNLFVRLNSTSSYLYFEGLQYSVANLGTAGKVTINSDGWTVYIPQGSAAGTYNGTYDWICYPNEKGNYGLYRFTGNVYVDNDAMVFAISENNLITDGTLKNPSVIWSGSINGGDNTKYAWNTTTSPPTDVTDATEIYIEYTEKGELSTKLNRVVNKYGDNSVGIATTIIPIEYHVITENDSAMISILQIVPLLLLIVPVMMAVRMYSSKGE